MFQVAAYRIASAHHLCPASRQKSMQGKREPCTAHYHDPASSKLPAAASIAAMSASENPK
jgi:hypothetical protein